MNVHVTNVRTYLAVFVALLLLLSATVAAAYVDLGPFNVPVALAIAGIKAALVGIWFMHLRDMRPLNWLIAVVGLLWLALLIGLTQSDYWTRNWLDP